ncbi:hypothetical protein T484DRAFT_1753212 [Baffinella frigidus]|nr:hypothetical protein T484DRAFT_1753212 [Cryptophyta sp. CCMP2293]
MPCCRRWATSLALLLMLCAPGETHTGPHCLMRPSAHSGGLVPDRGAVGARVGLALRLRGGARKGGDEKRASHSSVKSPGKDRSSRARSESPPAANAKPAHSSEKSPGKKRDSSGGGGSIPVVSPVKGVSKNKKKKKSGSAATGSGKGKDKAATEEGADGEDKEQSLRSALSEKMGALLGDDLEDDPAKMQRVLEAFSEDNESETLAQEMRAEIASDEKKEANEKANKEARQQALATLLSTFRLLALPHSSFSS